MSGSSGSWNFEFLILNGLARPHLERDSRQDDSPSPRPSPPRGRGRGQRCMMGRRGRHFARVRMRMRMTRRMKMRMIWGQEMARFLRGFRGAIFADWPMNFGFPGGIGPGNFHQHNRLVPLGCSWVRRGHPWDRLRWQRHLPQGHPWAVEKDWTRLEWLHFLRRRMTRRMSPEGFRGSLRSMRVIYFQGV